MQMINENDSRNMEACGWDDDFWEEIGLGDLVDGHHAKIGTWCPLLSSENGDNQYYIIFMPIVSVSNELWKLQINLSRTRIF